jgi:hypothetical protein
MDCDKVTRSERVSNTLTVGGEIAANNLKKIADIKAAVKDSLVTVYSEDRKNNIAYSVEFCESYNSLIDLLNKLDKERRDKDLPESSKAAAETNYQKNITKLLDLLLNNLKKESVPPPPPPDSSSQTHKEDKNIEKPKSKAKEPLYAKGYVEDAQGNRLAGVKITLDGKEFTTDGNGFYKIPFDASRYKREGMPAHFSKPGFKDSDEPVGFSVLDNSPIILK